MEYKENQEPYQPIEGVNYKQYQVQNLLQEIMDILGVKENASNTGTPRRVAKMWCEELFWDTDKSHMKEELTDRMKLFPNEYGNEAIIVKDIPFNSYCEHHLLPFSGKVDIGYIPNESVLGLSKIPRVVKYFSQRPQLQEKLTGEIGDYINKIANPIAVYVIIRAEHTCVKCRGVMSDCETQTSFGREKLGLDYVGSLEHLKYLMREGKAR